MNSSTKTIAAAVALGMTLAIGARANTVNGSLWFVSEAAAQNATPANVPLTPADVTFTVNTPLNFHAGYVYPAPYTVSGFLGSGGATILTGSAGALASSMDPTIIEFTGSVTMHTGDTFNVEHDDGLTLTIGSTIIVNQPGPTAPANTLYTWTGADGTYAFQLVYGECCGAPAVLATDLPLSVPDGGSTLALLGVALTGLGAVSRRFRK